MLLTSMLPQLSIHLEKREPASLVLLYHNACTQPQYTILPVERRLLLPLSALHPYDHDTARFHAIP